jgi:3',5'-cyclic AMP phosphodiesterase CpdA
MSTSTSVQPQTNKATILHCSDLHFGHGFQAQLAEKLLGQIEAIHPDLVVVSGDLTMRARPGQFSECRAFLQRIKVPLLLIPGNHDVPLFNLVLRAFRPFENYTRYTHDLGMNPALVKNVAIYGINSVNPKRHQQGHFTQVHLQAVSRWLADLPASTWRIVVTHQHFVAIPGFFRPGAIRNAQKVLSELAKGSTHAILCGHMHFKFIGSTRDFFPALERPIALIHAGTATSSRLRGPESVVANTHVNNFMLLEFSENQFVCTPYDFNSAHGDYLGGEKTVFDREFFGESISNGSAQNVSAGLPAAL